MSDLVWPSPVAEPSLNENEHPAAGGIGLSGSVWVAAVLIIVVPGCVWLGLSPGPLDRLDAALTRPIVALRTEWLDQVARGIDLLASRWVLTALSIAVTAVAISRRRFRHLIVFLVGLALLQVMTSWLIGSATRVRPLDVTQIGPWEGYAAPSLPTAVFTAVLMGFTFMVVVPGRPRTWAKFVVVASIVVVGLARIYLGTEHPTDVLFGAILGVGILLAMFRGFVPDEAFPVTYGPRGKGAHLDVGGPRGDAIRTAVKDQLGLTVHEMKPIGLEGSAGSTPLKLTVTDGRGDRRSFFAKLYARSHVRSDRSYKFVREVMHGALEDETPFKTVRRLVEYEDYALRLLGDYGFPIPAPLGVVEITPEREYLIAMEFFDNADEIGSAPVDDRVIDQGLQLVRRLWDVGLAHRDIKPANLMVQDGDLKLIDASFLQVRPSPWRRAVDLGNMLLVLALRSDAETVYGRALRFFTPEEIADALAAAGGVTIPSQLRTLMKRDRPELLAELRGLAPQRRPIPVQRWGFRRLGLIALSIIVLVLATTLSVGLFVSSRGRVHAPPCESNRATVLMAQAVPSAMEIPCISSLPIGWRSKATIVRDRATVTIEATDVAQVEFTLSATCETPADAADTETLRVAGGCIVYTSSVPRTEAGVPSFAPDGGLDLMPRSELVSSVAEEEGLRLCGAGAPCP